jgi:PAS domain S-box-containing protein
MGLTRRAHPSPSLVRPAILGAVALAVGGPGEDRADAEIRALFDAVPNAELLVDERFRIFVANAAAHRMFGAAGEALRGRPFEGLFVAASRPSLAARFSDLGAGHSPADRLTTEGLGPGGVPFSVEVLIVRLTPNLRCPFGAVVRSLAEPVASGSAPPARGARAYSLPELLLANRLKEMV